MGLRGRLDSRLVRGDRPLHTRSGLTVTVPIRVKLRASRPQACRSLSARCLIKFAAGRELPGLAGHHARHGDLTHPGLAILMVATPTRGARGEEAHGVQIHSDRRTHSWAFQGGISRCGMTPRDRACRSLTRRRRYGGAKRNQCTRGRLHRAKSAASLPPGTICLRAAPVLRMRRGCAQPAPCVLPDRPGDRRLSALTARCRGHVLVGGRCCRGGLTQLHQWLDPCAGTTQ